MFAGIGMMLVGVVPAVWWWKTRKIPLKYFAFGVFLWIISIAPKVLMDLTITPFLRDYLLSYGTGILVVTFGLYVGLRTGLFESGFTYIAGLKTKLREVTFDQAVAFGLGFGGIEAVLLGLSSFLTILLFAIMPDLINQIPEAQREIIIQQLNRSTWIVFAPILERCMALLVHVFASLLVFYAIRVLLKRYLLYSIGYKTIVDGVIPALTVYVGSSTLTGIYLMELPFVGFGLVAVGGILWVRDKWRRIGGGIGSAKGDHYIK
jgi:uncharacterized membrane protein YhfC